MMLLSIYGTHEPAENSKTKRTFKNKFGVNETVYFSYPTIFNNHFKYRFLVDLHNAKRHYPISVEETLGSKCWATRQFCFLLGITEVNCGR